MKLLAQRYSQRRLTLTGYWQQFDFQQPHWWGFCLSPQDPVLQPQKCCCQEALSKSQHQSEFQAFASAANVPTPLGPAGQSLYTIQWSQWAHGKEKLPISLWRTCSFPLLKECSSKNFILKRKGICSGLIRNVWEASVSFCLFTLKITEPAAQLWILRENQPNFQEKYYLCEEKAFLAPLFFIENHSIFWCFFLFYQPDETDKQGVENTSDWFFLTFRVIPLISSRFPIFWTLSQNHVEETMSIPLSRTVFLEGMQKGEVKWFFFK